MRRIGIVSFTPRGGELADRIERGFDGACTFLRCSGNLRQWCEDCFAFADALIFIGACGIAVRTVAPFLKSKTTDPAVLVLDEAGQYVISLLSGHLGGANGLARAVAEKIGATPVITTASDVNGTIAVDVFAQKNRLHIRSMKAAREIAAAILRGERVGVRCTGEVVGAVPPELCLLDQSSERVRHMIWISVSAPSEEELDRYLSDRDGTVLHLIPRAAVLGVGCRKGKTSGEIRRLADRLLAEAGVAPDALCAAASIDLKKDEPGLLELCAEFGVELITYTAEELAGAVGAFQPSEFVRQTTGVDNICERAAVLAAGPDARLVRGKRAENGVTAALAERKWRICFEE